MEKVKRSEIEAFLKEFHLKLSVFRIVFENREKNLDALLQLEITGSEREEVIKSLIPEDYFGGPTPDTNDTTRPPYWEFGKMAKGKEVYIKINMGHANKSVICISFHIAEHKIVYPLKKGQGDEG
jgi:hypothetical protein